MALLAKLKSILGLSESGDEDRDVTVTVEHDPQNEADVEGAETGSAGTSDAGGSGSGDAADESDGSSLESAAIDEPGSGPIDEAEPEADTAEASGTEDASEPEDASETAGVEPDAAEPVDSLSGIGSAYADRLAEAGIETVGDLAAADAAEVAEGTDLSEGRVQGWIDQANEQ